jgi:hypothetical protein
MEKAIEILQSEALMLEVEYDIKSEELRLARKYGKKSEIEERYNYTELIWAKLSTVVKLIKKLEAERVEA